MANQEGTVAPAPQERTTAGKPKAWRAKCTCTYKGMYVREGEIVYEDRMDNPHFEKYEPKSEKAGA